MNQIANRTELLSSINTELTARGLKNIRKLGDSQKGEFEIVALKEVYDHSARFFTDVKFAVLFPGGKEGEFTVRFNANGSTSDGAIVVVVVNGRFAIVKQWRLPLSQWTYEIPRGFGEKLDAAQINGVLGSVAIGDLPLGTVTRELGEEVMKGAVIQSITHLCNIAENSGTNNIAPGYYLVQIKVDEEVLSGRAHGSEDELKLYLWDSARVQSEIGQKICDSHSITAIALARRHIDALPRM
ncbi:MAG: hypothetical protein IPI39_10090 [Candidatus Obscuribacter sp.]|jgi:hypothetical protein|nr:hypothetical protein [Candidatus Obscuribacter sp.]MBK9621473.1 hypothetical protein [Candidatus Obscuribacter sp.]